jgi:aconitate hydratase
VAEPGRDRAVVDRHVTRRQFVEKYADVFSGAEEWQSIDMSGGALYDWVEDSTYIQEPPFFLDLSPRPSPDRADSWRPGARQAGRLGDHRPHLTGRVDQAGLAGRPVPDLSKGCSRRCSTRTARVGATTG